MKCKRNFIEIVEVLEDICAIFNQTNDNIRRNLLDFHRGSYLEEKFVHKFYGIWIENENFIMKSQKKDII